MVKAIEINNHKHERMGFSGMGLLSKKIIKLKLENLKLRAQVKLLQTEIIDKKYKGY